MKNTMNRRNFLRSAGVTAVGVTAASMLSACSSGSEATSASVLSTTESSAGGSAQSYSSYLVDTGQSESYDNDGNIVTPSEGEDFYGQDGIYTGAQFNFTDKGDGTVTDNNTGLTWQQTPPDDLMSWQTAGTYCEDLSLADYDDWRMPTAKELFSISDFTTGWPYLDQTYFEFPAETELPAGVGGGPQGGSPQGDSTSETSEESVQAAPPGASELGVDDESANDGISKQQGQFWTSNYYMCASNELTSDVAFGVNHATGHIKAYPASSEEMGKHVRAVRGGDFAINQFTDNGDTTITDEGTGLMWAQADAGEGMEWKDALAFAENSTLAGYDDWRLPDVKELQSIVDYTGNYPAIDPSYFDVTVLDENEFYYFWTSTSAYFSTASPENQYAWYVAFGYAVDDEGNDTHGAGAVRFSPKYVDSSAACEGGDNILNSVRIVRNA